MGVLASVAVVVVVDVSNAPNGFSRLLVYTTSAGFAVVVRVVDVADLFVSAAVGPNVAVTTSCGVVAYVSSGFDGVVEVAVAVAGVAPCGGVMYVATGLCAVLCTVAVAKAGREDVDPGIVIFGVRGCDLSQ